ncbi:hypothetical protein GCM10007147_05330 [Nocardiopsis kunsanensis]|uniref:FxLD family lantipeptide n=1 Tax=Nocardiopsis kunsanensis TaxID=141693 RepID=A0A918X7F9_9ACTN|nr:FxLD family lanthipeptide [Nocardiopsis kunsanensis]GHD16826.1 hypothetical protein GCM10007147_05330 [Nocardiopsis kunsanensis]
MPFELDMTLIEDADAFDTAIDLTEDNCGNTCEGACCTSAAD